MQFCNMSIEENIKEIRKQLPEHVKLVAVSKYQSVEKIFAAYSCGQKVFGENKAQEMSIKYPLLPADIEWHFIGHLQSNKIKNISPFVSLIQSVDSLKLLIEINTEANKINRLIPCLLQFFIASETSKFGLSEEEASALLDSAEFSTLKNVRIDGVMGMATYTDDLDQVRAEFDQLAEIFKRLKSKYFTEALNFKEISIGMSDDFPIAVEAGSTIVRVGSAIFGERA